MTSSDSQHSLLSEQSLYSRPQRSWNPLGRSSPEPYLYHPASHDSWSEDALRDIGLGISNTHGDAIPLSESHTPKRDSIDSDATTTPAHKTPQTPSPHVRCANRGTVLQKRLAWVPLTVFVLAVYATVFSGIYLAIALRKPRWSRISSDGPLAPSTANLLSAFFAKTIELAYVTVCVAFLGQVLSRRALMTDSRGISISDMNMRAWIMQPGSMIVHWETLRYSALTFLGAIALVATFVAMLYTTAAQALVAPKLSLGSVKPTILQGKVVASFANPEYVGPMCQTPVTNEMDPINRNTTCLQIEHAGKAYHNYEQWLNKWADLVHSDNETSSDLHKRPKPAGSIWDNTTVTGSWIEVQDMTTLSKKHNRMINNVTMAMPHGGIPNTAMDPKNKIKQPNSQADSASGEGKYNIEASVPSPAVNVLCAGMSEKELQPLVYTSWPGGSKFNTTTWSSSPPEDIPKTGYLNRTVVDDIFQFGPSHGQVPPVFGKFPKPYNTILNVTGLYPANAIYLLGASPPDTEPEYVMCALRAKQTGHCSTKYNAGSSGAALDTRCEDPSNDLEYARRQPGFIEGVWESDWKNVASEWANSLSLGAGISDGAASNARLLMQMVPQYDGGYALDAKMPSIAEALAVMAGCTLILSSQDAPFYHFWNYTGHVLGEAVYQRFNGTVQAVSYASGAAEKWQGIFFVILVFAFLTSAVCLGFMIVEARGRQVTDFTEPQNLFALAVNSPQSSRLEGACGCGPCGKQLKERWFIGMQENDEHYYIGTKGEEKPLLERRGGLEPMGEGGERGMVSPMVNEFRKVSKRTSFLAKLY
ncbi:hypothetical protein N7452_009752 [Penicillium brevicompactum]|uniref:Uncharacterized protein n=1 Tax=Penicillium brevicompactum TaxID=5074 RepID=A0A9W9QDX1_PENBR|nr:hypothetical protein N7452_009752 [Penicillium brevicompactum]